MADNWQDDPAMKRAAFIGMIGNGALPAADRIAMAQQVIRELETLVADRPGSDLSEDLHSAARCGQPGPHACPGCVIDGLREELGRANAELVELRYERNILGYARMILDRAAEYENLSPVDKPILRREAADCAQRIVDEIGHAVTDEPALGPELREEIARLTAQLAEVRTGKSRVGDGIDRRGWTDAQWLEEARSIFCDAFGGAGDLLNGHISAMWKQLTTAKHEQEQLVAIVAATLRQLGTVLGVNIGEEIRKHVSAGPGLSGTGTLATPTESSAVLSNVESGSTADGPEPTRCPNCDGLDGTHTLRVCATEAKLAELDARRSSKPVSLPVGMVRKPSLDTAVLGDESSADGPEQTDEAAVMPS